MGIRQAVTREVEKRQKRRDFEALKAENDRLLAQNERLRVAMRRCVTCEYRKVALGEALPHTPTEPSIPGMSDQ